MEIMYQQPGFLQLTTPACNDILVFEEKEDESPGSPGGIKHFGFRLKDPNDIDEIAARVVPAGGLVIDKGEFVPGSPFIFCKDPDGYIVEVWFELLE